MTLAELRPVLQARHATQLASDLDETRARYLTRWGEQAPTSPQTQKTLGALWKVTQGAVSTALTLLQGKGYVVALPRGAGPAEYVLSGTSRLIFGDADPLRREPR